ncbi:MAG: response regulator, partial [Vulcanimicrobiota bacterium]
TGKGSTFYVDLPLKYPRPSASVTTEMELPVPEKIKESEATVGQEEAFEEEKAKVPEILLVEDNPINRKLVETFLKDYNCNITIAKDGQEAIDKASENHYNLILMDIQLPKVDGYKATRTIRGNSRNQKTPIVALTAHAMKGDDQKALESGCDGYLTKPIDKKKLVNTIDFFLTSTNVREENSNSRQLKIDPEVIELTPWYLENLEKEANACKEALKKEDFETVRIKGHGMKGSGSSFGFSEISELGKKLEISGKEKKAENSEKLIQLLFQNLEKMKEKYNR